MFSPSPAAEVSRDPKYKPDITDLAPQIKPRGLPNDSDILASWVLEKIPNAPKQRSSSYLIVHTHPHDHELNVIILAKVAHIPEQTGLRSVACAVHSPNLVALEALLLARRTR